MFLLEYPLLKIYSLYVYNILLQNNLILTANIFQTYFVSTSY